MGPKKRTSFDDETIQAKVALREMVIDDYQGHVNQAAFSSYTDAHKAYTDPVIYGIAQFFLRFPKADTKRLIERLKQQSPTTILGMAANKVDYRQSLWVGVGRVLTSLYNRGFRPNTTHYLPQSAWDKLIYSPNARSKMKIDKRIANLKQYAGKPKQEKLAAKTVIGSKE